jgi:hypothetical protein
LADSREAGTYSFLLIGSSHTGKIGASLAKLGHKVSTVYEANWRVVRNNSTFLAETVNSRMVTEKVDYLIFALLDNSIYHALAENGDMLPPAGA